MIVHQLLSLLVMLATVTASAQTPLRLSSKAWADLSPSERAQIQKHSLVETLPPTSFGVVLDNQAADRSTPGTSAGANLGQAIGNATYIDRALSGGNYSAKTHLGALLLGGLLGSTLDSKGRQLYLFRYALRLGDGTVVYRDTMSSEPFRHPVGVCLLLPQLALAPDQTLCGQTAQSLRQTHLPQESTHSPNRLQSAPETSKDQERQTNTYEQNQTILCKLGLSSPVRTTKEKCQSIAGEIINE